MKISRGVILLSILLWLLPLHASGAVIVIDPGHGGEDPGAVGCSLQEHEINLDVSLKLRNLLTAAGHTVHMTRTSNATVSLSARASFANSKNATTFASIHTNAFNAVSTGIETFCYAAGGARETQARNIQTRMLQVWSLANRGVKYADFSVLRNTNMPATLSELAFITNCTQDAPYLRSSEHRMNAARAHCRALVSQWGGTASACEGGSTPPAQTGEIIGFTFEGALNGPKIAGASVKAAGKSATSDSAGLFKFAAPIGSYTLTASKSGYDSVTRSDCSAVAAGSSSWCSVAMQKSVAPPASGTIIGFSFEGAIGGTKITGATVNAAGKSFTTGADSLFKITAPVGAYTLTGSKAGYNSVTRTDCEPVKAGADSWCSFALTKAEAPNGNAAGYVADSVSKAKVAATVAISGGASASYNGSTDWNFSLKAGSYTITATANGYDSNSVTCAVKSGATTQCPILINPKKATIKGNVTDADTGSTIAATIKVGGQTVNYAGSGEFSFTVDAGNHTLIASAAGYNDASTTCSVAPGASSQCSLKLSKASVKKGLIFGTLVDASSGVALEGLVQISDSIKYYTDYTGVWRFNLDQGDYSITASAEGYNDETQTCTAVSGVETECVTKLVAKASSILGKVVNNASGATIAATVSIEGTDYNEISYDGLSDWTAELAAGSYVLKASAEGFHPGTSVCLLNAGRQSKCAVGLNPVDAVLADLRGIVHDSRSIDQLLPATVTVVNGASLQYPGTGEWVFESLATGNYIVKATSLGYYDGQANCRVIVGETQFCAIALKAKDENPSIIYEEGIEPELVVFSGSSCSMSSKSGKGGGPALMLFGCILALLLYRRRKEMMKLSRFGLKALLTAMLGIAAISLNVNDAQAEDLVRRLDSSKFWKIQVEPDIPVIESELLATELAYPKISPDAAKIAMVKPKESGIYMWTAMNKSAEKMIDHPEASLYVEWQNNDDFSVRVKSAPFERDAQRIHLTTLAANSLRVARRVLNSKSRVHAYDFHENIVLEEQNNVRVISDDKVDRYFAPTLSPDQKYVAYTGLSTGIYLFDLQADAVVFVGEAATEPIFSADSRYLLYVETKDDGHHYTKGDVVILDLSSKTLRRVANPRNEIRHHASISNNGYIAYQTVDHEIYRAKLQF